MKSLGIANGPDVDAELAFDAIAVAERELRAAAAGVEDDQRPVGQPGRRRAARYAIRHSSAAEMTSIASPVRFLISS